MNIVTVYKDETGDPVFKSKGKGYPFFGWHAEDRGEKYLAGKVAGDPDGFGGDLWEDVEKSLTFTGRRYLFH